MSLLATTSFAADVLATEQNPLAVALVETLRKLSGGQRHGYRANHARDEDALTDAPIASPADLKLVELGTISLTSTTRDQAKIQKTLVFDPVALPDGIAHPADLILLARFQAYAVALTSVRSKSNTQT